MAVEPKLAAWGNSFAPYAGSNINSAHKTSGEIDYEKLNNNFRISFSTIIQFLYNDVSWASYFQQNRKNRRSK